MTFHRTMAHQNLWQSVLFEAVNDAIHGPTTGTHGNRTPRDRIATWKRDRAYVLDGGKDFAAVCHLAGVDPVATREAVARQCEAKPITDKKRGRYRVAKPEPKAKPAPQRYEHDGLSLTAEEWSERTGINAGTIKSRINRHQWPVARAVTEAPGTARVNHAFNASDFGLARFKVERRKPQRDDSADRTITRRGDTRTVRQWSEATGLSRHTIRKRLKLGWDAERILTTPIRTKRAERTYTLGGETLTLSAWAERTGIPVGVLRNRATKGWDAERALTTPVGPARSKGVTAAATTAAQGSGAGSDFTSRAGTGGGRHAQHRQEMEFPA